MNRKKKVAIIGTNGLPAKYGGFETLTHYLTHYLKDDFDFIVYCSKTPKLKRLKSFHGTQLKYFPLKANGWQSVLYDAVSILHAWMNSDILLVLGPTSSGILLYLNKFFFKKKIIINFGGVEWRRGMHSRLQQKFAFYNAKVAAKISHCNIADNSAIKSNLLEAFSINNCKIIEYGGDHVNIHKPSLELLGKYSFLNSEFCFSLGRAQIDNNQHLLLEVFSKLPSFKLVLVSNWSHNDYGKKLKEKYSSFSNIFMLDPIYNQFEIDTLRSNCKIYIHSHSQCGTAPSLVEAMNLNIPIISFDVPTNRITTFNQSFYYKDAVSLKRILTSLSEDELSDLRQKMYKLAKNYYSWDRITLMYKNIFNT